MQADCWSCTYLKQQCGERYCVKKAEDGLWNLITRFPERGGLAFKVYVFAGDSN